MLDLQRIDLRMLADLLGQRDYGAGYLDPATGAVYPAFEGEVIGDDGEPVDLEEADWLPLGGEDSREAYADMADFAAVVADPLMARRLADALEGRGAFRRFRNVVYDSSQELGKVWNGFRDARAEIRALDWLEAESVVDPAAAEAARAERRALAEGMLADAAGRPHGSRPTMTLVNGLPAVGKSAVASLLADRTPGALCLDIDKVRDMVSGPFIESAEAGRSLGLAMAEQHLRGGYDVVVPQLVARRDQLERFEAVAAAAGAAFVHVVLQDAAAAARLAARAEDDPRQPDERELAEFAAGLEAIRAARPDLVTLDVVPDDPDATAAAVERLR